MNYKKIYSDIIKRSLSRGNPSCYCEKHHIIPRSMGGSNSKDNLTLLTGREHFIAHWLLYKIHKTPSMAFAFNSMCMDRNGKRYSSRSFQYARKYHAKMASEINSGEKHPMFGTKPSEETRKRMSISATGRKLSDEAKIKVSLSVLGRRHSEETKKKMSIAHAGKIVKESTKLKLSKIATGKKRSKESRLKQSEAGKKTIIDQNGNIFKGLESAGASIGATFGAVCKSILRDGKCKGVKFSYLDQQITRD